MWSFAIYNLRLTEEQFWRLSLNEFMLLVDRHKEQQRRDDWRAALICATLANVNSKKKYQPKDFMPKEKSRGKKDSKDMVRVAEGIVAAFGGTDKRQVN